MERVKLDGEIKEIVTQRRNIVRPMCGHRHGATPRNLGIADEDKLVGRGVNYCAACDGMFYKGKTVAVIGGGNSAAGDALLLSKICEKVVIVHRRDTLRAEKIYHAPLMKAENVEFCWNSTVEALCTTRN